MIVGVLGASGGVGASSFAAVLAAVAGPSLLIDLDVAGGGIDATLGVEAVAGARWSGLHLAGGYLDPATLLGGLPRWGRCAVLAADVAAIDPAGLLQILDSATDADLAAIVLDLPRSAAATRVAALPRCDLLVVLTRSDVAGLVAAHALTSAVHDDVAALPVGLVVRRGGLRPRQAAALVGAPLVGVLPSLRGRSPTLDALHLPRAVSRVARGVLVGLRPAALDDAVMSR